MHWEKHRSKIWNLGQHPYRHSLSEFAFANPAIPGATNVEAAMNYILAILYPNAEPAVNTVGDLPALGNEINDYRVVLDDGDGKQAAYRWEQREGEVSASWHKVADMDWSNDSILAQLLDVTQPLYVYKSGLTDIDGSGNPITGLYAGQTIFGGDQAGQNLTLNANSGDGVGVNTGFIQLEGNFRPVTDDTFDLSTISERFRNLYLSNAAVVGTTTIGAALITDSSGTISFDNENLITTGNINGAVITGTQLIADDTTDSMVLAPGSITDSTGSISLGAADLTTTGTIRGGAAFFTEGTGIFTINALEATPDRTVLTSSTGLISFDDEDLITTGNLTVGELTSSLLNIDNLRLDGNTISTTDTNGNLILTPNGSGFVQVTKGMQAIDTTFTGIVGVIGQLNVDSIQLDGNTISVTSSNANLTLAPNGTGVVVTNSVINPGVDATHNLGAVGSRFQTLHLSGGLNDGTDSISMATIMSLRSSRFRDANQTIPAETGDSLFYDAVNGVYLASVPDNEISHNTVSGLTTGDAGHTQFAMLAGRSGGQTIIGGTGVSESLTLQSTSDATRGSISFSDNLIPTATASFSGGWSGTDLGDATHLINDIYSRGEHKGLRFENVLSSALPAFSGQTPGRMYFATDVNKAYVDTGSALKVLGVAKYSLDQVFNGTDLVKDVDVSSEITDARQAQWQLLDNANNFEIMGVTITMTTASNVRITTNSPLAAGSYRLIGVE